MNKEKDFFKTCFNTVAGLEVKNESQAIAKEVVLSEIENLQQENKILKENAENNDKVVDKVNWENMLLKKENKQLKNKIKELVKYGYGTDMSLGEFKEFYKLGTGKDYDPKKCPEVE